jgi:tetratricopeptide (TPR) repeat protein
MATVLLILVVFTGYTQTPSAAYARPTILQIDSLNNAVQLLIQQNQFESARQLSASILAETKKMSYQKGAGEANIAMATIMYDSRDFVAAAQYGQEAVGIFIQTGNDSLLAQAYVVWAQAVWAQSRFDEAINGFNRAASLFGKNHDSAGQGNAYSLIALAEEERGNYEASFQYATKALALNNQGAFVAIGQLYADVGDYDAALEYYARMKDPRLEALNVLKVGETFFLKRQYDSSFYYYRQYLNTITDPNSKALSKPYVLMGELYVAENKYDTALFYLQSALAGFREVNDRNWVMRSLLELGKAYKELNRQTVALQYTRELLTNAEQTGARQYERDAHYLLYQLFAFNGSSDSAYRHLEEYTTLNNSLGIDLSARKLAFFKSSAQLEQAGLKIALLNRQKQLQDEAITQARQQKFFLAIGLIVLAMLFIIIGRNFFLKRRSAEHLRMLAENELEIEKLQHTKKLSELEMQVLRVQMNPHFIFNSLNSINRFILRNNKTDASEYLTKFSRLVRMILQNSQSSLITLENELDSLRLYLELEALRFDHRFDYNIVINKGVDITMLKVPPLVMQPYVENAIWHGLMPKEGKGHVEINISSDSGYLFICIADDGVGRAMATTRSQAATHRPLGLQITSQRIDMMHHTGDTSSAVSINDLVDAAGQPAGTEVTLKLPMLYD